MNAITITLTLLAALHGVSDGYGGVAFTCSDVYDLEWYHDLFSGRAMKEDATTSILNDILTLEVDEDGFIMFEYDDFPVAGILTFDYEVMSDTMLMADGEFIFGIDAEVINVVQSPTTQSPAFEVFPTSGHVLYLTGPTSGSRTVTITNFCFQT